MPKDTPDWTFEAKYNGPVCGVDEAGRGPLAGPVVAAAVILDPQKIPDGLNDSKALSEIRREYLLNKIWENAYIGVGIAEPEEIDRVNVLGASMMAMQRAVLSIGSAPVAALIDGNRSPDLPCETRAIVKGDSRSLSIAAASIVAKVTRDRLMKLAHERYPAYRFDRHKGYPTQAHRDLVKSIGPCPIHRRSFAPVRDALLTQR